MSETLTGTIKWFNPTKGVGFITPADGSEDVMVDQKAFPNVGLGSSVDGRTVEFEAEAAGLNGRLRAKNVKIV
ncbi:cold shock domain-containing protein [Streptomyces subrutilus]|nr:cold shock domain-containing protein [Streptomyces subrutilus]